ncbi:MAG: hydrogenase [Planctomycetota bacterium]
MNQILESLLVAVVLLDFFALGGSRLRAVIRATALQGAALAAMPIAMHGHATTHLVLVGFGTLMVKGVTIPWLLNRALRDVTIRREVEPTIGFTTSLVLGAIGTGFGLAFADSLPLADEHAGSLAVPASFATMIAGFLILATRRKAITQVVGYMILENGVFLFGLLLLEAQPFLVEIGVLLDLLVGVFVMGITMHRIQREFSNIDAASFTALRE